MLLPPNLKRAILQFRLSRWKQTARASYVLFQVSSAYVIGFFRLRPNSEDRQRAKRIYLRFKERPGSDHIASEHALAHLSALLRRYEVKSVLEFGAGIGTITYLLLDVLPKRVEIVTVEQNEFCLEQLNHNISSEERKRLSIVHEMSSNSDRSFDLVIIDGKRRHAASFMRPDTLCFAEGSRSRARQAINAALARRGLTCSFKQYPTGVRLSWRKGLRVREKKGCWIGAVEPLTQ